MERESRIELFSTFDFDVTELHQSDALLFLKDHVRDEISKLAEPFS